MFTHFKINCTQVGRSLFWLPKWASWHADENSRKSEIGWHIQNTIASFLPNVGCSNAKSKYPSKAFLTKSSPTRWSYVYRNSVRSYFAQVFDILIVQWISLVSALVCTPHSRIASGSYFYLRFHASWFQSWAIDLHSAPSCRLFPGGIISWARSTQKLTQLVSL